MQQASLLPKLVPIAGYALLAFLFYGAFSGSDAAGFLQKEAFIILVVEFVTIHSTPFFFQVSKFASHTKYWLLFTLLLIAFYSAFVGIAAMQTTGSLFPLGYFWFTSLLKASQIKARQKSSKQEPIDWKKIAEELNRKNPIRSLGFGYLFSALSFGFILYLSVTRYGDMGCQYLGSIEIMSLANCPDAIAFWGVAYFSLMAIAAIAEAIMQIIRPPSAGKE